MVTGLFSLKVAQAAFVVLTRLEGRSSLSASVAPSATDLLEHRFLRGLTCSSKYMVSNLELSVSVEGPERSGGSPGWEVLILDQVVMM